MTIETENEKIQLQDDDMAPTQKGKLPALTVVVQSWATPIIGLVMLVVGLFGGYAIRPMINAQSEPPDVSIRSQPPSQAGTGPNAPANQELMDYLVSQTRHFRGDPNAPVTLIEFGDFQ
jgi:hypothetical protein